MQKTPRWISVAMIMVWAVGLPGRTEAADAVPDKKAEAPTTQPSQTAAEPSAAEKAMEQLRRRSQTAPVVERTESSGITPGPAAARPMIQSGALDRAVIGVAPGTRPPVLRREGEFVISRKGRVIGSPGGDKRLFHFEADAQASPEAPMFLLPCRLLQNIEDIVHQRGDQAVFIVTGQVFVYRGANHLLPTMFTLSINKGNLRK